MSQFENATLIPLTDRELLIIQSLLNKIGPTDLLDKITDRIERNKKFK